ncbi:23S rRNA (adenine(1618)-N(6))-methyltransferase RlmF [Reinekea marinisedimentorum]|uniref:Ribosomal RNA large subunit methyltransferase F n=1 Tax=Reinekea marinisedimentorum TaxID=230495 RepID=A0A4R3IC02_9GAMM|nr:23S rRNA (adenine(1618)-N(6))-methyltransferase RlmF [Reinekea marinisedimentorum]TCS43076.1 23S rRNA (adenine1618-N6)-methyltransferase [Reinekea marinisedimentorum]
MKSKGILHERNLHKGRYDLALLCKSHPPLAAHLTKNPRDELTIDFANPLSVLELNRALLKHYYGVSNWDIPPGYLCPPIPGRSDYVHYTADLLLQSANRKNFKGLNIRALDVGTGANLIYPIVGSQMYHWQFVASEVDPVSIENAAEIIAGNRNLQSSVSIRRQSDPKRIFDGVIQKEDYFQLTMCNPPFFKSQAEASSARMRKTRNLSRTKPGANTAVKPSANFGGSASELFCDGGELAFIKQMIRESAGYGSQVGWFTSLISNGANVSPLVKIVRAAGTLDHKVISMTQGNKSSRILAWTFKEPARLKELILL